MSSILSKKSSILLLFTAASFLLSTLFYYILPFHRDLDRFAEKYFFKVRYRLKGKEKITPELCIFNIDDSDIRELGITSYDRPLFTSLIKSLQAGEAKTVVFDFLFLEEIEPLSDKEFARSSSEADFLFIPLSLNTLNTPNTLNVSSSGQNENRVKKLLLQPKILKKGSPFNTDFFQPPYPDLAEAARGIGTIALKPDGDYINRRLPLVFSYKKGNEYIPSLVLLSLCHYLDVNPADIEITFGKHIKLPAGPGGNEEYLIPIDKKGRMIINYSGPWQDSTENYSLKSIFSLQEKNPGTLTHYFSNTLVVVSDISSTKKDYSPGIFDTHYPNSGIISNALNTILTGNYLKETGLLFTILTGLLLVLAIWIITLRFRLPGATILMGTLFLLSVFARIILFTFFNILPVISIPLFTTLFALTALIFYTGNTRSETATAGAVTDKKAVEIKELDKKELEKLTEIATMEISEKACRENDITRAQRKLLVVLQKGHTYKEAAGILGIQVGTINKQLNRIKEKTGIYQKKDLMELFFPFSDNNP